MKPQNTLVPVLAGLLVCTLTSCLTPHKLNKWVAAHYTDGVPAPPKTKNDRITVTSKFTDMSSHVSEADKNWSHIVPLIFYWHFDYKNTCTLNPEIPVTSFKNTINSYGGRLRQKLNGGSLELSIDEMPNVFAVDDKGFVIWVIYAFGVDYISVQPQIRDLTVSYRLLNANNEEVKKGSVTIKDINTQINLKMFHSTKKMTWDYLEQYDANITSMSKRFVDRLAGEL
jgi:hypothetical protein